MIEDASIGSVYMLAGSGSCVFLVKIDPICFLARCRNRQLNWSWCGFVRFRLWGFLVFILSVAGLLCQYCSHLIGWPEMICYVC